jgi:hypothetical protein
MRDETKDERCDEMKERRGVETNTREKGGA